MPLSKQQIDALVKMIASAETDNGDCDSCYQHLAEFAECELLGKELPAALRAVETHLKQCPCCQDEYDALLQGLRAMSEGS